ncbi:hypothetical protein LP422_24005 [Janibacter limosus]|uniref:hypothetical protein n=1 Tax=Janibacter limosus TaxID=53458 RepID=UPI0035D5D442|nr:hypothetical protein LP422_24005 [Janibacter limosus]
MTALGVGALATSGTLGLAVGAGAVGLGVLCPATVVLLLVHPAPVRSTQVATQQGQPTGG